MEPDLFIKAREKKLNLSALMDQAIEQELNKEAPEPTVKDIVKKTIDVTDVLDNLKAPAKKPMSYVCDFCGLRLEGQYHVVNDAMYCTVCNRQLSHVD